MMNYRPLTKIALVCLFCLAMAGCGQQSRLTGRWYNKDISIRIRPNGTVLYNSRSTGLVEGRYHYEDKASRIASTEAVKNLTIWLPQPQGTIALNFEARHLGNNRLQLKEVRDTASTRGVPLVGIVLKRAAEDANTDTLDPTPTLVSANRDQE